MSGERSVEEAGEETLAPEGAAKYAPRAFRNLPVLRWTDVAGEHRLTLHQRMSAGSASDCGIVIADATVSRLHAELEPRLEGVWVHDLGSRNGTLIDGVMITGGRAEAGATVRLGSTDLRVEPEAESAVVELWPDDHFGPLVGASVAMRELFACLARIAPSDAPVLVRGETGTGKELAARAIHEASPRASGPFVVIDCGALTGSILESELFGHARGAFTGADAKREGALESANGGTVFLDEIGELSLAMQPRLLRAFESRTIRRVGETGYRPIDVRFISATHRDLRRMVNAGSFREDLYFRLSVLPVIVPPLRDRPEDVGRLVAHFMAPSAEKVDRDLVNAMAVRPWMGNVRELRNFVERARVLGTARALALDSSDPADTSTLSPAPLLAAPEGAAADRPFKEAREAALEAFERSYVRDLLARHGGNVAASAQSAGLNRTYLYRIIRKYDL